MPELSQTYPTLIHSLHKHCARKACRAMHHFIQHLQCMRTLEHAPIWLHWLRWSQNFEMLDRNDVEWVPNLQLYGCDGNEDTLGKLSRMPRRVSARLASQRALDLYLIKIKAVYRPFKKNLPWMPLSLRARAFCDKAVTVGARGVGEVLMSNFFWVWFWSVKLLTKAILTKKKMVQFWT